MGIRAMPWGPPPKGAQLTSKNNANQQKFVMRKAQLAVETLSGRRQWAIKFMMEALGAILYPKGTNCFVSLHFYPHAIFLIGLDLHVA